MTTLDPRLDLTLAVIVLVPVEFLSARSGGARNLGHGLRKASVRISNLLWQEQTVTRDSVARVIVWVGELPRSPEAWISSESQGYLVRLQILPCE